MKFISKLKSIFKPEKSGPVEAKPTEIRSIKVVPVDTVVPEGTKVLDRLKPIELKPLEPRKPYLKLLRAIVKNKISTYGDDNSYMSSVVAVCDVCGKGGSKEDIYNWKKLNFYSEAGIIFSEISTDNDNYTSVNPHYPWEQIKHMIRVPEKALICSSCYTKAGL